MADNQTKIMIVAIQPFFDLVTYRGYDAGDEINGWDDARVKQYVQRGLVEVVKESNNSGPCPPDESNTN